MASDSLRQSGGFFYNPNDNDEYESTVFIDKRIDSPGPDTQNTIRRKLKQNETLRALDLRYAILVAGASKMPMSMVWVPKNMDSGMSNSDRAIYKNIAWNTFVRDRFLDAPPAKDDEPRSILADVGDENKSKKSKSIVEISQSMLQIVEKMNLEWVQFQLMGLHEQVEASELNLVIQLCQSGIIPGVSKDFSRIVYKLRRMDLFYEVFALAVGGYVCAHAPYTMGAASTRYERDLQFKYKRENTNMLAILLKQNMHALFRNDELGIDYIEDISSLSAVRRRVADAKASDGGDGPLIPPSFPGGSGRGSKAGRDSDKKRRRHGGGSDVSDEGDGEVEEGKNIGMRLIGGSIENVKVDVDRVSNDVQKWQNESNKRIAELSDGISVKLKEKDLRDGVLGKRFEELDGKYAKIEQQFATVKQTTEKLRNDVPVYVLQGVAEAFTLRSGDTGSNNKISSNVEKFVIDAVGRAVAGGIEGVQREVAVLQGRLGEFVENKKLEDVLASYFAALGIDGTNTDSPIVLVGNGGVAPVYGLQNIVNTIWRCININASMATSEVAQLGANIDLKLSGIITEQSSIQQNIVTLDQSGLKLTNDLLELKTKLSSNGILGSAAPNAISPELGKLLTDQFTQYDAKTLSNIDSRISTAMSAQNTQLMALAQEVQRLHQEITRIENDRNPQVQSLTTPTTGSVPTTEQINAIVVQQVTEAFAKSQAAMMQNVSAYINTYRQQAGITISTPTWDEYSARLPPETAWIFPLGGGTLPMGAADGVKSEDGMNDVV